METQASCFWCEGLHGSKHPLSVCRGCADTRTRGRRAGGDVDDPYTRFAYSYAPSADAAFAKEWPLQQRA
jgi:hypothetical protein